jgi:glutamyl-tRNA reductase
MERLLRTLPEWKVTSYPRQQMDELFASKFDALVVCTGGNEPWLDLPKRHGALCIDAGSPPQVRAHDGWRLMGLDTLLARPDVQLMDTERNALETLVMEATQQLSQALSAHNQASTLAAIDAERTAFLNEHLPALLVGLPRDQVRKVRQAVGAFTHAILQKTREVSS